MKKADSFSKYVVLANKKTFYAYVFRLNSVHLSSNDVECIASNVLSSNNHLSPFILFS